jgi:hypothetical protein
MCRPVFRYEDEPTAQLRATLRYLKANGGDALLMAGIRNELIDRALGVKDASGFPAALRDTHDDGLPFN